MLNKNLICISQTDAQSDVGVSPGYINSRYTNFHYSSAHPNNPLEQPDTEYITIIVVVVIFVVLFVSVNLVLDFFGVWFWVAFAAAFINLLLCMWLMCGPGCKDPLVVLRGPQLSCPALTSPTSLGVAFQRRRDSRGRRSEEGGSVGEIGEEERTASPPAFIITTTSSSSPSPTNCDPHLSQLHFEAPPSYEEALSMKVQEETKFVQPS